MPHGWRAFSGRPNAREPGKFPCLQANSSEFSRVSASNAPKMHPISKLWEEIPYAAEQGIFRGAGNFRASSSHLPYAWVGARPMAAWGAIGDPACRPRQETRTTTTKGRGLVGNLTEEWSPIA